jgi:hypothetical protein
MKLDKDLVSSRGRIFRAVVTILLFCLLAYMLLWLPLFLLSGASNGLTSHQHQLVIVEPREELVLPPFQWSTIECTH